MENGRVILILHPIVVRMWYSEQSGNKSSYTGPLSLRNEADSAFVTKVFTSSGTVTRRSCTSAYCICTKQSRLRSDAFPAPSDTAGDFVQGVPGTKLRLMNYLFSITFDNC